MIKEYESVMIEGLTFSVEGPHLSVKVLYPDGKKINLSLLEPLQIGVARTRGIDKEWHTNIVTKMALIKYKEGITDNIELVGFNFKDMRNALLASGFLTTNLLNGGL